MSTDFTKHNLPELNSKQFNAWKLLEFAFYMFTNNQTLGPIHHMIYTEMMRLENELHWPDSFGLPTETTASKLRIKDERTYRKKRKELENVGMIRMLESGRKNHAPIFTLKTEVFQAFVLGTFMMDKAKSKMGVHSMRGKEQNAGASHAPHLRPYNKTNGGQAPILDEDNRGSETAHAVPPAREDNIAPSHTTTTSKGRYARYGLPDVIADAFHDHLEEKGVEPRTVAAVLSCSKNVEVLKSLSQNHRIKEDEAVTAIQAVVSFLQEHPSAEGLETVKDLTLTPAEKKALREA
jgi:hypothetical protein